MSSATVNDSATKLDKDAEPLPVNHSHITIHSSPDDVRAFLTDPDNVRDLMIKRVTQSGSWFYVENTEPLNFPQFDRIRATYRMAGFKWSGKRNAWWHPTHGHDLPRELYDEFEF